jgi:hypothetical protein
LASDTNCSAADASHADHSRGSESTPQARTDLPTQADRRESRRADAKLTLDGFTLDEATLLKSPLLPYLAIVASLIEGRTIRADQLLSLLLGSLRQRSLDRLPRREYVLRFLDQHPP